MVNPKRYTVIDVLEKNQGKTAIATAGIRDI
jgi:hypothetical protein